MRPRRRLAAPLALALMATAPAPPLLGSGPVAAPRESPPSAAAAAQAAVREFYDAYARTHRTGGLPDARALRTLGPLLTPRLRDLVERAGAYSAESRRRHPDEKPPFVDGDLFTSNFEGASRFEIGEAAPVPSGYRVSVRFQYSGAADSKDVVRWTDAVWVVSQEGRWLVDDVEFGADWPFANHGRLSETLRSR